MFADQEKEVRNGEGQESSKAEESGTTQTECVQSFREGRTDSLAQEVTRVSAWRSFESIAQGIAGRRETRRPRSATLDEIAFSATPGAARAGRHLNLPQGPAALCAASNQMKALVSLTSLRA